MLKLFQNYLLFSLAGAAIGVKTAVSIDPKYFTPISFGILILVFLYALKNKNMGEKSREIGRASCRERV